MPRTRPAVLLAALLLSPAAAEPPGRADRLKAVRDEYAKERKEFGKGIREGRIKPDADGEYPGWTPLVEKYTARARVLIDADPADAVGLDALLFCLSELGADKSDLYRLVLAHHAASDRIDPLLRSRSAPIEFLRGVMDKAPHPKLKRWASFHLAENLYAAGKPADAKPLLEALRQDAVAKDEGGYHSGTLADTATRLLFEIRHLNVGQPVPEVSGADLDGKPMTLSEYRGRVTLLVFWATWCGPCMEMIPHEKALAERYADRSFAVVGVNGDTLAEPNFNVTGADGKRIDDSERVKAAVEKHKITWRSFRNGQSCIGEVWNVRTWPTVYLIDHAGVIRGKWRGDPGVKVLDAVVDELVKTAEAGKK